jgi:hypothetical protein
MPSKINNRETPIPEESLVSGLESFVVRTQIGHSHQIVAAPFSYGSGDPHMTSAHSCDDHQ